MHAPCIHHSILACMQIAYASLLINGSVHKWLGSFVNFQCCRLNLRFLLLGCSSCNLYFKILNDSHLMALFCLFMFLCVIVESCFLTFEFTPTATCNTWLQWIDYPLTDPTVAKWCLSFHTATAGFSTSSRSLSNLLLAAIKFFREAKSCSLTWAACHIPISCLTIILV